MVRTIEKVAAEAGGGAAPSTLDARVLDAMRRVLRQGSGRIELARHPPLALRGLAGEVGSLCSGDLGEGYRVRVE